MTIRHLKVFIAVADCGKMSLAAKTLYVAQPTVSQAISEVEQYYGIRLFERLSRRLYLTPQGEQLLGYARHIVALFEEMELDLQNAGQHSLLKVGATITVGACVLPGLLRSFESQCAPHLAEAYVGNTRVIEEKLMKSQLDVGVVEGQVKSAELISRPLMEDELILVCPPKHPLAQRAAANAQDLRDLNFVLREPGSGTRELFEQYMSQRGVPIYTKWVCHSTESIKNAVIAGQGVSVLSRRLVLEELSEGRLVSVPLSDAKLVRQFCLLSHKNKFMSPALQQFIRCALEYAKTINPR